MASLKTKTLSCVVKESVYDRVVDITDEKDITISSWLTEVIMRSLQQHDRNLKRRDDRKTAKERYL